MRKFKVHPCLTLFKVICPIFLLLNDFQLHGFKKSSHRIFRLNNIAKVLSFLEERNVSSSTWRMGTPPRSGLTQHIHACTFLQVKLVSIDAADVADGNASIILGLIWNIILFFQVTFVGFPLSQLGAKHKKGSCFGATPKLRGRRPIHRRTLPQNKTEDSLARAKWHQIKGVPIPSWDSLGVLSLCNPLFIFTGMTVAPFDALL